jgi:uncharacterized metal-binding protein
MAPVSGAAWLVLGGTPKQALTNTAIFIGSHLACSYWLSPDLDIDSAIDNRWGILGFLWKPYEKAVPHRHWLSHSGFSVLLRLLYLLAIIVIVLLLLNQVFAGVWHQSVAWTERMLDAYPLEIGVFLLGAIVSDAIHTISDYLSTSYKRNVRRMPRFLRRLFTWSSRQRRKQRVRRRR